jgi:peroxiredoxin
VLKNRHCYLLSALVLLVLGIQNAVAGMELQKLSGERVDLDDYRGTGKWLLVMIWATDCHICHQQKPLISDFHDKHQNSDAEVIGIALDGPSRSDEVKRYLETTKVTFPTLVGEMLIVSSHYLQLTEENLRGTPTYLLFSPDGELLGNNPGPLRISALEAFIARHE